MSQSNDPNQGQPQRPAQPRARGRARLSQPGPPPAAQQPPAAGGGLPPARPPGHPPQQQVAQSPAQMSQQGQPHPQQPPQQQPAAPQQQQMPPQQPPARPAAPQQPQQAPQQSLSLAPVQTTQPAQPSPQQPVSQAPAQPADPRTLPNRQPKPLSPPVSPSTPPPQEPVNTPQAQVLAPAQTPKSKQQSAVVSTPPAQAPQPEPQPAKPSPAPSPSKSQVVSEPKPAAKPAAKPEPQSEARPSGNEDFTFGEDRAKQQNIDRENLEFVSGSDLAGLDPSGSLLFTEGLVKIYGGRTVVNGVNIAVRSGEIVGLLGPNGAGKTTSFYMIVGLVPPNGGTVMFNGMDVSKLPMYKRARLGMGYLPQEESIFRKLTVEENIMAVMQTMNYSRKEKKERCEELLERFSITHIRKNMAMACSGGEKRRVTIARSLVPNPSIIMLDEPFAGVDPIAVNEIQGIVHDLREEGLAILITDHNARQTLELVDRAYLIFEGRVLREGPRDFLVNDPVSRELYLGERFSM